jgi:site-specific recombinase XerD
MLEKFIKDHKTIASIRAGMLGPYLDAFVGSLHGLGYARATIRSELWLLSDFGRWMARKRVCLSELDERIADRYVGERRRRGRFRRGQPFSLQRFIDYLRQEGIISRAQVTSEASALSDLERRYESYLRIERGLTAVTADNYLPFIHRLLVDRFGDGPPRPRELGAADVSGFILRHASSMSRGRAKLMVTALRSFFRFLFQHGEIEADLADMVPAVSDWRQSTIPKYLTQEEIERLLDACDRRSCVGRRDHAVLTLIARLGLRAGEVMALELDDIDWRAGEIHVRGKGLSSDRLPLLPDVGESMAEYLRRGRPASPSRQVFICMKAPRFGFSKASSVSTIVSRTLDRAGLAPPVKGAHLLRFSLATGMLHRGASMAEIAEVLRHRQAATTEIYAKVDLEGLRSLAQPWPGKGGVR